MKTKAVERILTKQHSRKHGRVPLALELRQELIEKLKLRAKRMRMNPSEYMSLAFEISVLKNKISNKAKQELEHIFGLDFSHLPTTASQLEKMNRILIHIAENPTVDIATLVKELKEKELN